MSKPQPKQEELVKQVAELTEQLEQAREAKLMALADLDNFRKRVEQERQRLISLANISLLRALIEAIDDMERMIHDLEEQGVEDKIDAFKPVLDKLRGILVDYSVQVVEIKAGDDFKPEYMEAIGVVNVQADDQHNKVVDIAQKAYKHKDGQIVRMGRVVVGKKS